MRYPWVCYTLTTSFRSCRIPIAIESKAKFDTFPHSNSWATSSISKILMKPISAISPLVKARIAGFLYLFGNPFAPFFLIILPSRLIVHGDAAKTASNIMASEWLFRLGIVDLLYNSILGIFLALALYQVLEVVNKNAAWLMVVFALVGVPIGMFNEINNLAVLQLFSGADYLNVFTAEQLQALAYFFTRMHALGVNINMIFWGLWLLPMGYLVFKSGFLPKIIGVMLVIACIGYVAQSFAVFLGYRLSIILITGWGELMLGLWLLIKGVNVEQWQKRALESA
ncbi:MAG: DUF4386 domain-containing protein [Chloroflexi bacterium]|nr:DUF4386 domain-containing protein [Chloroflexota bacterium]